MTYYAKSQSLFLHSGNNEPFFWLRFQFVTLRSLCSRGFSWVSDPPMCFQQHQQPEFSTCASETALRITHDNSSRSSDSFLRTSMNWHGTRPLPPQPTSLTGGGIYTTNQPPLWRHLRSVARTRWHERASSHQAKATVELKVGNHVTTNNETCINVFSMHLRPCFHFQCRARIT